MGIYLIDFLFITVQMFIMFMYLFCVFCPSPCLCIFLSCLSVCPSDFYVHNMICGG